MKSLIAVQAALKAPKDLKNNFGGYKYRSTESILEALKPLLFEHGALLTISDEVIQKGDRYYVQATAIFSCDGEEKSVTAEAREAENKKGMDESQITGAASSYARKYALNGLFCIDDTKDADATNDHKETPPAKKATKKTAAKVEHVADNTQLDNIRTLAEKLGATDSQLKTKVRQFGAGKEQLGDLSKEEAAKMIGDMTKALEAKK